MTMMTMHTYILFQGIRFSMSGFASHYLFPIGDRMDYCQKKETVENWILEGWINKHTVKVFQKTQEKWSI